MPKLLLKLPPVIKDCRPSPEWPNEGEVLFDNYSTRYRQGLDLVLQDISVKIPGGTKYICPFISHFLEWRKLWLAKTVTVTQVVGGGRQIFKGNV